jgi:hypothetical protein
LFDFLEARECFYLHLLLPPVVYFDQRGLGAKDKLGFNKLEITFPVVLLGGPWGVFFRISSLVYFSSGSLRDVLSFLQPIGSCSMPVLKMCPSQEVAAPHHKQRGTCLQLAQMWPNFWHL